MWSYNFYKYCIEILKIKVVNLFQHIKFKSKLEDEHDYELSDLNGDIKSLNDNKDHYAFQFLKEKEKYILVKIDRNIIIFLNF